jgi:AcrR family transcriptional regulator/GNAT superfamily N-acetyltransferase
MQNRSEFRRSLAKRDAILRAGADLVAKKGYNLTRIEHIAEQAGVGKQTIYRWWPTKFALLSDVYEFLLPHDQLVFENFSLQDMLFRLFQTVFKVYRETGATSILVGLIVDAQNDPAAKRMLDQKFLVGRRDILTKPLRDAIKSGELPISFDVTAAADLIVALIWHRILTKPNMLNDQFALNLTSRILQNKFLDFPSSENVVIEDYTPGSLGWVCGLQAEYYARAWGFNRAFEAKITREMGAFMATFDAEKDLFQIIKKGNTVTGSIVLDSTDSVVAHLRWFFVDDSVRGLGLGSLLLSNAITFARSHHFESVYLWTFDGLNEARHLYEKAGFRLIHSEEGENWGKKVIEQKFELLLH